MRDVITQARRDDPPADANGTTVFEFCFDGAAEFFAGHFPGQPILPGIFQVEMTRTAAEWNLGRTLSVQTVRKAKFLRPVHPGETLRLALKLTPDGDGFLATGRFAVGEQAAGETQLRLQNP